MKDREVASILDPLKETADIITAGAILRRIVRQ